MKISIVDSGVFSKVSFNGRMDANTAPDAEAQLCGLIAKGASSLVFDLSGLDYVSSAGLRVMLVAAKRVQQKGGKLALYGLNENVREVFDISGFTAVFKIYPDEMKAQIAVK